MQLLDICILGIVFIFILLVINENYIEPITNSNIKTCKKKCYKQTSSKSMKNLVFKNCYDNCIKKFKKKENWIAKHMSKFLWPTYSERKVTHKHPALLYWDKSGKITVAKHGHEATVFNHGTNPESSLGLPYNDKTTSGQSLFNTANVNSSVHYNSSKSKLGKYHYTMPMPFDQDNKTIIDIYNTDGKYMSPILFANSDTTDISGSSNVGYLYPLNYKNNYNENAINSYAPYGDYIHNTMWNLGVTDTDLYKGKKHTHSWKKNNGLAKALWKLKKKDAKKLKKTKKKNIEYAKKYMSKNYNIKKTQCIYDGSLNAQTKLYYIVEKKKNVSDPTYVVSKKQATNLVKQDYQICNYDCTTNPNCVCGVLNSDGEHEFSCN